MTYEEVVEEAKLFTLDPGTEVVVERPDGLMHCVMLGLRHKAWMVDKPDTSDWVYNTEVLRLQNLTRWNIQHTIEQQWMGFALHELQEWLCRDGVHLYDPHGIRAEVAAEEAAAKTPFWPKWLDKRPSLFWGGLLCGSIVTSLLSILVSSLLGKAA